MNNAKRYKILNIFNANNSNPTTELVYNSAFELLIAVILSARSTDVQVNKVTDNLFAVASSPQAILNLGEDALKKQIRSIGLFNKKTENIIKTCELLVNLYDSKIPANRYALESLPGVGRKTANVILNLIFGFPTIAVDSHIFRFCNRSRFVIGVTLKIVERKLLTVIPERFKSKCHSWMVLHGRYVCTARKPQCSSCCIRELCEYNKKII
ncbi:endonuclease III [Blochmannia endosymbiont of Colobopsis nipponica]|uniref:endonuclease III n=1 Tax=Blochmannia endosymbiont of Colobopsis nipponica TaxID=2681987 RepID=UPI00177E6327|nr:endonuclease III [Blochmannia endosymbiont of Colobopsis nipponica]QOI11076.1 endonuclease III [Blochmannia endosymbiont of Colobopsis nipponica]